MTENNFFCLFDTGDFATVIVEKHDNDPSEPVQGFFVLEGGSGFSLAAKRAAVRVYSVLKNQGVPVGKYSAMFDLSMESSQDLRSVSGQSGGLAFALALASGITGKGHGAVAATGIIEADGSIGKVRQADLDAKIEAACRALTKGGMMLYPQDNRISDATRERVKEKNIEVIPVATVEQALGKAGIFETHNVPVSSARKRYLNFLFMVLLLLLALTVVGLFSLNKGQRIILGSDQLVAPDPKVHEEQKQPLPEPPTVTVPAPEKKKDLYNGFE